jgi:hypothetical protein
MKSKPGRYGMKIWIAADAESSCVFSFQVFLEKTDNKPGKGQAQCVLKNFVDHVWYWKRNYIG